MASVVAASTRIFAGVAHKARTIHARGLHPVRNVVVRRKLANGARPHTILVLCYGNVCRSPYLQAVLQRDLRGMQVMSAGFIGRGRSVPTIALELARERGLDLTAHRSALVTPSAVRDADRIVVMDPEQAKRVAGSFGIASGKILIAPDLAPTFTGARGVRDPMNQPVAAFLSAFDHLDQCAATLVSVWGRAD